MPFLELIQGPDGTVWYCVDRIHRYAIPNPRNLATYQAHMTALGYNTAIVVKGAADITAYGTPVFADPGAYLAHALVGKTAAAVDAVIEDEAILEAVVGDTDDGGSVIDIAAILAAIEQIPEKTRVVLAAALATP